MPSQHYLVNLFLTISFSMFVVASWALIAIVWFTDRLPVEILQRNESKLITWPAWIAPGLLGFYIFAVFEVASKPFGRIPVFSLLRYTLATLQQDQSFIYFFSILMLIILIFGLVSFGIELSKEANNQSDA
jgi:hypothetical protein